MPRKKIGPQTLTTKVEGGLAEQLAAELKNGREWGQPFICEQEFPSGRLSVTVIWDAWAKLSFQERTAVILRAYEIAEGGEYRGRIALANGLTVPEAYEAGMLPYQIITALRRGDPVTLEQAREAFIEEGASQLIDPQTPQLRFATEEEVEACRQRLVRRFPRSEELWIINREITARDFARAADWGQADQ